MLGINIVTNTSKGDIYKKVALNTYPIISSEKIEDLVKTEDFVSFIKKKVHQNLVEHTSLYIIDEEGNTSILPVKDVIEN